MIVQFLSDLHLDVNRDYPLVLRRHSEVSPDVVVVAGDVCGSPDVVSSFLKESFGGGCGSGCKTPRVLFVCGNHIVYNDDGKTLEAIKDGLHREFPESGRITFLDESVGVVSKMIEGVLFVGSCTYTDYRYPTFGKDMRKVVDTNMRSAVCLRMSQDSYMNDFRFGRTDEPPFGRKTKRGVTTFGLMPHHYRRYFHRSIRAFERVLGDNAGVPTVLITHHCLSPRCIGPGMDKGSLTASYISDMEGFIKRHSDIKAVISGHVHNSVCFDVERDDGSVCKYVMNPRGYTGRHESDGWSPYWYIDTDGWRVFGKPYENREWERTLKESDDRFMNTIGKYASCFL